MQGTARDAVIDLDRLPSKDRGKVDRLFKGNWKEMPQKIAINSNCETVKEALGRVLRDGETLGGLQ